MWAASLYMPITWFLSGLFNIPNDWCNFLAKTGQPDRRYRYFLRTRLGIPFKIVSEVPLEGIPHQRIFITLTTSEQRGDAYRRDEFPNYVRMNLYLARGSGDPEGWLHMFTEPEAAVRRLYPDLRIFFPTDPGPVWWGILPHPAVNRRELGIIAARILRAVNDIDRFGEEAVKRAQQLLYFVADKHGWQVFDQWVVKGPVKISRVDLKVYIDGSFRCITSDSSIPKDDQVVQKLLYLSSPSLARTISTLSEADLKKIFGGTDES
jgi:hypothetical protein